MFANIGLREILVLVLVAVLLFKGGELLPKLVRGLGDAVREFRKSSR